MSTVASPRAAPRSERGHWSAFTALVSIVAALFVTFAPAPPAGAAAAPIRGIDRDHADPAIIHADRFYAYGTSTRAPGTRTLWKVPVRSSIDLETWSDAGDALAQAGSWTARSTPFWAPSVSRVGAGYVLYYSARRSDDDREFCIGSATASAPVGPFVDSSTEPLVCSTLGGEYEAIDPMAFVDADGARYLYYKTTATNATRLWVVRLDDSGLDLAGTPRVLLSATEPWEDGIVENPEMTFVAGQYWLLYSVGLWSSADYATAVARCDGPTGPCRKLGRWRTTDDAVSGPGGMALVQDGSGAWWAAYSGWRGRYRAMYVDAIVFGPDGPIASPDRTSPLVAPPVGALDVASGGAGVIRVAGWSVDPDSAEPVGVLVTVDDRLAAMLVAADRRDDVAARDPIAGAAHGFDDEGKATAGTHTVCVTAMNNGPGARTRLGCRTVAVSPAPVAFVG
jgi:hypothetical protein